MQLDKVLMPIPWFAPAFKAGGPVQSVVNMLKHCNEFMDFYIVTPDSDIDHTKLQISKTDAWVEFDENTHVNYVSKQNRFSKLIKIFKSQKYPVAFMTGIYSFSFTLLPLIFVRSSRKVLSVRGMLHPPALAQKRIKKKIYLAFLKPILRLKKVEFHATDDTEKQHILAVMGNDVKIWVVPNIPRIIGVKPISKQSGCLKLLTVALIGPMKNHLKVLLALTECKGEIEYDICGPVYWPDYWEECLKVIQTLPQNIKVRYHGPVPPQELIHYYQESHIFICPSQSENYGHALFESFSAGRPVITSYNTPWNNLSENNIGLNVSVQNKELKMAIDFFSEMNQDTYNSWSQQASDFAIKNAMISSTQKKYQQMFSNEKNVDSFKL
jgi:glycosyltransferase involved in cell wall biosynthesis